MKINFGRKNNSVVINFGKIDYQTRGRKNNSVIINIELKENTRNKALCLTIDGKIWNHLKTDIVAGGQCLDEIAEYRDKLNNPELFDKIYTWWKKYHLNNAHVGTPEQEKAIEEWRAQGNEYNFEKVCEYLKSINLYEVLYTGKGANRDYNNELYRYGSGWLIHDIPEEDLKEIMELLKEE